MESLECGWGEEGRAGVDLQFIVEVQLFAEPDDAFGLGAVELGLSVFCCRGSWDERRESCRQQHRCEPVKEAGRHRSRNVRGAL